MNILIFSSAMSEPHFNIYQEKARIKPNPSNQVFYSKLIKALSINNNVSVVTLRPFRKGMFKEKFLKPEETVYENVKYYYSKAESSKLAKLINECNEVAKAARKAIADFHSNDFIVIADTLRLNLLKAAIKIGKEFKTKVVGMLTDNPYNLTNVSKLYAGQLTNEVLKCDAFLSLTKEMVENINEFAPFYVFEGLVENISRSTKKDPISNYYFFGGALYERYGVKRLVDAFRASNFKHKLVVAGSGPLESYIDMVASKDTRILYLGPLSHEKYVSYELNAIANINPRPLDTKLDKESVPSKLLEYFSTGIPTISTKFPMFSKIFKDDTTWIEGNTIEDIQNAIAKFEACDYQIQKQKALTAKNKVFEFYGLEIQGDSITHFLKTLK